MQIIPKIAHFYWGAKTLPYLRYLTLYSFKKYNPDWKIILYIPKILNEDISWKTFEQKYLIDTEDCFYKIKDLKIEISIFDMESIGFSNTLSEVIKSDILRWHLLYESGGLWSDMDILYFKSIDYGIPSFDYDACLCFNNIHRYHSIGFLLSKKNCEIFKDMVEVAKRDLNMNDYQSVGWQLLFNTVGDLKNIKYKNVYNIPMEVVYPTQNIAEICDIKYEDIKNIIKDNTIGLHWYAGHPKLQKFVNQIGKNHFDNIIGHISESITNV